LRLPQFISRLSYTVPNAILNALRKFLYRKPEPDSVTKLLIVRKGNLGDMVCSVPVFNAIQHFFSGAEIHLLTTMGNQSLIGADSVLVQRVFTQVFEFRNQPMASLRKALKREKYDAVIELPPDVDTFTNQLRNLLFFRSLGINSGWGWTITNTLVFRKAQLRSRKFVNEQARLACIVAGLGIHVEDGSGIYFTEADLAGVQPVLQQAGHRKCIAVAPGAKLERRKWPQKNFRQVVEHFAKTGYAIFVVGDTEDARVTKEWDEVFNMCGRLTVPQSAALLSACELTITNDSGPMHLSYSVGTPVLALFSARNYPGKWFPPADGKNQVLVNYEVACAICRDQPCAANICMTSIQPETVIRMAEEMLKHP
jgi:ADP-heptose:LPS heptosyltransferase